MPTIKLTGDAERDLINIYIQVIETFLRPLELAQETGDPGRQHYLTLIAYITTPPTGGRA